MPGPSPIPVRQAVASDVGPLSATLARAFADDPVITWIFGTAGIERRLERYFGSHLRHISLRHQVTYTSEGHTGGAIWLPPGHWMLGPRELLVSLPSAVRALGSRLPSALRTLVDIEKRHPKEPHYYLATLGTDPPQQGKGVGSALLAPVLERCDREEVPAFLESSKEQNLAFYGRHGFEVTERLDLRKGGPPIWLMWRTPRPA